MYAVPAPPDADTVATNRPVPPVNVLDAKAIAADIEVASALFAAFPNCRLTVLPPPLGIVTVPDINYLRTADATQSQTQTV
jgi:hypothetical protein